MNAPLKHQPDKVNRSREPERGLQAPKRRSKIEQLLLLEAEVRAAESLAALQYLIANETRKLVTVRQVFVHSGNPEKANWCIEKVSSLTSIDRNAPAIRWLQKEIANGLKTSGKLPTSPRDGTVRDCEKPSRSTVFSLPCDQCPDGKYPFPNCSYFPFADRKGRLLGGMTLLTEQPLGEADVAMAGRISATYSHAWSALKPRRGTWDKLCNKKVFLSALAGLVLIGFIPVRLTISAPVEIVARDPIIIAAPLDGVIEEILVAPNAQVQAGDLLLRYDGVNLENKLELAERAAAVSSARYQRASQSSFGQGIGKRELAVTRAEYEIAIAERNFAKTQLSFAQVSAPTDGVALHSGRPDWTGRPVSTGERIMRLADPRRVEFKISVAAGDTIILQDDASVRVFLDSDPLNPMDAKVVRQSYMPIRSDDGTLVFPLTAQFEEIPKVFPRIGFRGTAQVYGDRVPLAFDLFRKPIAAIRQFVGL